MKAIDLKERLGKGENVLLLDIREKEEFGQSEDKIEGAQNIPMGKVFTEESKGNLPKDKKIVTICRSGTRCEIVARELRQKGYDIEHLEGGLNEWIKSSQ